MSFRWPARAAILACVVSLSPVGAAHAGTTYGSDGPSNVNTSAQTTYQSADTTSGLLSDRINGMTEGGSGFTSALPGAPGGGRAAGNVTRDNGVWFNVGNTWTRSTQPGMEMNGPIFVGLGGIDRKFEPWLLLGLAGGYERIDITTGFNNGRQSSNAAVVAAYGAVRFSPNYSIDGQFGHAWVGYNESHGATAGAFTGDRWFGATNLNAGTAIDAWRLLGSVGYFYVSEVQSRYVETNGNDVPSTNPYTGQVRVKGQVGYVFETAFGTFTPFAAARLEYDTNHSAAPIINSAGQRGSVSEFGTTFILGVKADLGDYTSLILEGRSTQFRANYEAYSVNAALRIKF